jgi:hypothetical protein
MYPSPGSGERDGDASNALRACSSTEGYSSNPPEGVSLESVTMRACSEFPERSAHSVMPAGNALASLAAAHDPLRASLLAAPRLPRPPATPRLRVASERDPDVSVRAPAQRASDLPAERWRRSSDVVLAAVALAIGFGGGLLLAWALGLI